MNRWYLKNSIGGILISVCKFQRDVIAAHFAFTLHHLRTAANVNAVYNKLYKGAASDCR